MCVCVCMCGWVERSGYREEKVQWGREGREGEIM